MRDTDRPNEPVRAAVSERKLAANRRNARLSTGPKTAEGKLIARMNAVKHGLCARTVVIPGEDPALFDQRFKAWAPELNPQEARSGDYMVAMLVRTSIRFDRCCVVQDADLAKFARDAIGDRREEQQRFVEATIRSITVDSDAAIRQLMGTAVGCRALSAEWGRLEIPLAGPLAWDAEDGKRALMLTGEYMPNHNLGPEVFFHPTRAIEAWRDADLRIAGNEFPETLPFMQRYSTFPSYREKDLKSIARLAAHAEVARGELLAIIGAHRSSLATRALELDASESIDMDEASLRARFDSTERGKLIHRYGDDQKRTFLELWRALKADASAWRKSLQVQVAKEFAETDRSLAAASASRTPPRNEPTATASSDPGRAPTVRHTSGGSVVETTIGRPSPVKNE